VNRNTILLLLFPTPNLSAPKLRHVDDRMIVKRQNKHESKADFRLKQ